MTEFSKLTFSKSFVVTRDPAFDFTGDIGVDIQAEVERAIVARMRRLDREIVRQAFGAGATTKAVSTPQEPLTLDKIANLIDRMPTRETWVVSDVFPPKVATIVKTPDENFTCMDAGMWREVEMRLRRERDQQAGTLGAVNMLGAPSTLYGVRPVFLDEVQPDPVSDGWRINERRRILGAIFATIEASLDLQRVFGAWWRRLPEVMR
jgi:hypothetical protein